MAEAADEIRKSVNLCRLYAYQLRTDSRVEAAEPLGMVVSITPSASPLATAVGQIAASVAAGNAVIAKPSSSAGS
ncbi:aldehyde dehydrogenase family protein, partial [Escherichia coli]